MTAHWQFEAVDGHLCRVTSPHGFILDFKDNDQLTQALLNCINELSIVTTNGDVIYSVDGELWVEQADAWINPGWDERQVKKIGYTHEFMSVVIRYLRQVLDEVNRLV